MIDLLWGRSLVFESPLSLDEMTKRLQREVAPATWQLYETRRQLFIGTFDDGRFRMMRLVRGKNSFRPLIEGHLSPSSTGVRIDVQLKLHPVVLIFCAALFLVAVFTASIALPEAFAGGASVQAVVIVLAFTLAVVGTLAIVRFEANEATRLLAGLFEAQAGVPGVPRVQVPGDSGSEFWFRLAAWHSYMLMTRCLIVIGCIAALVTTQARQKPEVIRVWKVGSPHGFDTPDSRVLDSVVKEFARENVIFQIGSFPATELSANLEKALAGGVAPDVFALTNYGMFSGIGTNLGIFTGIGQDPRIHKDLVWARGSFDGLLAPVRGWTFLLSTSPNYALARRLALRSPECGDHPPPRLAGDLGDIVPRVVGAYLRGDELVAGYSDPERMTVEAEPNPSTMREIRICRAAGNEKLLFLSTIASYEGDASIGHTPVLLVFRKQDDRWQLLAASRDPISNGPFLNDVLSWSSSLQSNEDIPPPPLAVTLLAPPPGVAPSRPPARPWGDFIWQIDKSSSAIAHIAEFAWKNDSRLFFLNRGGGRNDRISNGSLASSRSEWKWRVWSVNRAGDVAFSEARSFPN